MKNYIKAEFQTIETEIKDQLIAILSLNDYDGFEEVEHGLIAYIEENAFDANLLKSLANDFAIRYTTSTVPHQNWNELWERNFEPVVVGDFCAIRAHFHTPFTNTAHEIVITPKMSFGTGHHATTYLMVEQMKNLHFAEKAVADFGTGTGILAILAEKLGAEKVLAIDYDDWSIENTLENIQQNNCKNINVLKTDYFVEGEKYKVILANINKNVILANANGLVKSLAPGGQLLVSGLLVADEKDIVDAFTLAGLEWRCTRERNNWIIIQFAANN